MKKMISNKKVLGSIVAAVIVIGLVSFFLINRHQPTPNNPPLPGVNYNPPTETEKRETQAHKDDLAAQQKANNSQPAGDIKKVEPVITRVEQQGQEIRLNAYVTGVIEDNGVCTATFTQGNKTFSKSGTGFADATTTNCRPIVVGRDDFAASGEWQVVLTYKSDKAAGSSQQTITRIQ